MEQDTQVLVVLALGIVALCVIARCSGRKLSAAEQIAFGLLVGGVLEPSLAEMPVGEAVQFERQGYFCPDPTSRSDAPWCSTARSSYATPGQSCRWWVILL